MDANLNEDLPLLMRAEKPGEFVCLGLFAGDDLRGMISRKEAKFFKHKIHGRCVIVNSTARLADRIRAMSSSSATKSLCTTYTEDLYPDSAAQLAHKKKQDIPVTVTASLLTVKKVVGEGAGAQYVPWRENEGFRRRRFNMDRIRPLFFSLRAAQIALQPACV